MAIPHKKIKILYQMLPYIIGGTERFLFNLIKFIDKEKFEPIIFSWANGPVINMFKALDTKIKIIDVRYSHKHDNLVNFLRESEINIIQSNHFYPLPAMAANIATIPHIWHIGIDIHDACPYLNLQQKNYILNTVHLLSKEVICSSEFLKQRFRNIRASKIRVISDNGIDFNEINRIRPDYTILKKFGCNQNCPTVGMVAYLVPFKRHIDFIYAARRVKRYLPNTKFFIFGSPYPSMESLDYANYLYKAVKNLGLDKDIIFTGFYKDILRAMAGIDLIVLPSINEGSSNAIVEAMALGKPVVATKSGANPEQIKDKITGLLAPPKNPQKLSEAIIEILRDPKKAKMMGEAARLRAKKLFDIRRIAHQYEELYQEVYRESLKS